MKTLLDHTDRDDIVRRVGAITAANSRRWGTMSREAMLAHVADQLRFATGELTPRGPRGALTWRPVKWFGIVVAPWPKGRLQASRELLATPPLPLEEAKRETLRLIGRFEEESSRGALGPHPMFGELSPRLWGRLAWRHLDYHLRQFGA